MLDEQRGDLKLRDLIESESERLVDAALDGENRDLDTKIGEQDAKSDEAAQTMKSYENRKTQKPIKDQYFAFMKSFISDLKVPNLSESTYKRIDCTISETGSDLPRALLAYYLAFIHTMRDSTTSSLCPLIIDTPVQQDQDAENAARMIDMCINGAPADTQVILGTVGLHGVKYDGYAIKTENKYRLLNKGDYEEVSTSSLTSLRFLDEARNHESALSGSPAPSHAIYLSPWPHAALTGPTSRCLNHGIISFFNSCSDLCQASAL